MLLAIRHVAFVRLDIDVEKDLSAKSGKMNTDDINPFVLALTDPNAYEAAYGIDPNLIGDVGAWLTTSDTTE